MYSKVNCYEVYSMYGRRQCKHYVIDEYGYVYTLCTPSAKLYSINEHELMSEDASDMLSEVMSEREAKEVLIEKHQQSLHRLRPPSDDYGVPQITQDCYQSMVETQENIVAIQSYISVLNRLISILELLNPAVFK